MATLNPNRPHLLGLPPELRANIFPRVFENLAEASFVDLFAVRPAILARSALAQVCRRIRSETAHLYPSAVERFWPGLVIQIQFRRGALEEARRQELQNTQPGFERKSLLYQRLKERPAPDPEPQLSLIFSKCREIEEAPTRSIREIRLQWMTFELAIEKEWILKVDSKGEAVGSEWTRSGSLSIPDLSLDRWLHYHRTGIMGPSQASNFERLTTATNGLRLEACTRLAQPYAPRD